MVRRGSTSALGNERPPRTWLDYIDSTSNVFLPRYKRVNSLTPMTQPKYKIGEKVWILYDNKPIKARITAIAERRGLLKDTFHYSFTIVKNNESGNWRMFLESSLFPTKEDLIKSL